MDAIAPVFIDQKGGRLADSEADFETYPVARHPIRGGWAAWELDALMRGA